MFPLDQFTETGEPVLDIDRIIEASNGSHWSAWNFLKSEIPECGGERGMALLRAGRVDDLLNVIGAPDLGSFS